MYKIIRKKCLNPTVTQMEIEAPLVAKKAKPGQFIILRVNEEGERIPLTVAGTNAKEGTVKIIDYDAAKTYKQDSPGDTTCLGTDGWAAPEQYGFMQSDPRTDVYAVGVMIKEVFKDNPKIQLIAARASSFAPSDRYETAEQLKIALKKRRVNVRRRLKLKSLFPPPGFRTMKWWKMMIAVVLYPFAIFIVVGVTKEKANVISLVMTKITALLVFFCGVDIMTSWTGIFDVLPFVTNKNIWIRLTARLAFAAVVELAVIVAMMLIESTLLNLFS